MINPQDPMEAGKIAIDKIDKIASSNNDNEMVDMKVPLKLYQVLEWLAKKRGTDPESALQKAIATEAYIYEVTKEQGGKLILQTKNNTLGEINFK